MIGQVSNLFVISSDNRILEYENMNACEFKSEDMDDYKVTVPVHVIAKHSSDEMTIVIGTTKSKESLSECEYELLNEINVFGLDDFILNIR